MRTYISFPKFMLSRHADLFKADALDYLNYNWRSLVGQDCEDFLLNTTRTSIGDIYGLGEELFYVVRFRCAAISSTSRRYFEFKIPYRASFDNDLNTTEYCCFEDFEGLVPLNEYLVPTINDYDDAAEMAVKKVFGIEEVPETIDAEDFAKRCGLSVFRSYAKNWSPYVMGALFLLETKGEVPGVSHDGLIPPNTIVINPWVVSERNEGAENNTIIHECVHRIFHWRIILLSRIEERTSDAFVLCNAEGFSNDVVTQQIERQANLIAPRILMRRDIFVRKAQNIQRSFVEIRDEIRKEQPYNKDLPLDADIAKKYLIKYLASDFHVSELSVKIRLIDNGFEIARGVNIFLDGEYVRPFSFAPGSLDAKETFTISRSSFQRMLKQDEVLRECIASGLYIFVENHVVLVKACISEDNQIKLSEFARGHLDLFALRFRVSRKGSTYSDGGTEMSCMLRLPSIGVEERISFHPSSNDKVLEGLKVKKQAWVDYYRKMNCYGIGKRLSSIMSEQGYSIAKLSKECHVNYETLRRYLAEEEGHRFDKRTFTVVCVILEIPFEISKKIIDEAGYLGFDSLDSEDSCYMELLQNYYGQGLPNCNQYLKANGIKPFSDEYPIITTEKRRFNETKHFDFDAVLRNEGTW